MAIRRLTVGPTLPWPDPNHHDAPPGKQLFQNLTVAVFPRRSFEPPVGEPKFDLLVADPNVAGRVVVIMVLGQRGRRVAEIDEAVRDVGVEIPLQPGEGRSIGRRNGAEGNCAGSID